MRFQNIETGKYFSVGLFGILLVGLFAIGFNDQMVHGARLTHDDFQLTKLTVVDRNDRPIEGAACTLEPIGADESRQIGSNITNEEGKVTLIILYADPNDRVEYVEINCAKGDLTGIATVPASAPEGEVKFKMAMGTN